MKIICKTHRNNFNLDTGDTLHTGDALHTLRTQFSNNTQSASGVELIMNENTYIRVKINPTENLEEQIYSLLSNRYFPRFKFQLIYLAKFSKIVNGEEVSNRWIKSDLTYNHMRSTSGTQFGTNENVHNTLMQKLDIEQLKGSGFQFQEIEVILKIYKVNDIHASSWIELPEKYKKIKSIINIQNNDQFCFLWCILAHLHPVEVNKNRTSNYEKHFNKFNLGLEFPMKVKDIPKFEKLNTQSAFGKLNVNVFELNGTVLTPIYINKNYLQPQIDLILYKNHYCLITKLHCLINKNSHMKHVCRSCLTAFSSQQVLIDHIDRCQNQKLTNITFSCKDQLKFEDYHMKVPVPIRVYADFECINQPEKIPNTPKVLFKQIPIAVGYYLIPPFGNYYYSYFGEDCTKWFVNEMFNLEKIASNYFKTNLELGITPQEEESFKLAEECWLCEEPFEDNLNTELRRVTYHDHLTGKNRGAAHSKCNKL